MKYSRTITFTDVVVILCAVVAWQYVRWVRLSIEVSFANEQTEIFAQMADGASEAIQREPPDIRAAVEFLDYTHGYYPSGSKQTSGSQLDKIVERSPLLAELRIIEILRVATEADFGTDVDAWVREFGNEAVAH